MHENKYLRLLVIHDIVGHLFSFVMCSLILANARQHPTVTSKTEPMVFVDSIKTTQMTLTGLEEAALLMVTLMVSCENSNLFSTTCSFLFLTINLLRRAARQVVDLVLITFLASKR